MNKGVTPTTYQKFLSLAASIGKPQKPVGNLNKANFPENCKIQDESLFKDKTFDVPELKELGINPDELFPCKFLGGELEGLKRLEKYVDENDKWVRAFEKPKTSPNSLEPSTTVLSPYLKFGCISPRDFYWRLDKINSKGNYYLKI